LHFLLIVHHLKEGRRRKGREKKGREEESRQEKSGKDGNQRREIR
jgi:hypothetical protein